MSKASELANLIGNINAGGGGVNRNVIINGAMNVAQRGTSSTGLGASDGYFTVDRYKLFFGGSTAGRLTMTQDSSAPEGFANSMKLDCTTADTSIAAGEFLLLRQSIEGQNLQAFAKGTSSAKPFAVSFYVKGNANATYGVELEDGDNSRYNSQSFAVTTDWTRVTKTFIADTTGSLDDDNALSLSLNIWLHGGSDFSGGTFSSNTWHTTTNQRVVDSQTSFFDSTDRTFFITGLQMEIGSQATPFEHRSFGEELALCQRYFEFVNGGIDASMSVSTSNVQFVYRYRIDKRASATAALVGTPVINDGTQQSNINSIINTYHSFTSGTYLDLSTGTVNNNDTVLIYSTSATVGFSFDAEL